MIAKPKSEKSIQLHITVPPGVKQHWLDFIRKHYGSVQNAMSALIRDAVNEYIARRNHKG